MFRRTRKAGLFRLAVLTIVVLLSFFLSFQDASAAAEVNVFVCGRQVEFPDQRPFLDVETNRVYVPLRFVSEALGADVGWDGSAAIVSVGSVTVWMPAGRREVLVKEKGTVLIIPLDAPAIVLNGRTVVPLRFVSEALGCRVTWDAGMVGIVPDLLRLPGNAEPLDRSRPVLYGDGYRYRFSLVEPRAGSVAARTRLGVVGSVEPDSFAKLAWKVSRGDEETWHLFPLAPDGRFSVDVWLPFGPGEYTVGLLGVTREKAIENGYEWQGAVLAEFKAVNSGPDVRFLAPLNGVDWDDPAVLRLAGELAEGKSSDMEKILAVHDWVARNITYDVKSYLSGDIPNWKASDVLRARVGVCEHYSRLAAALLRAIGIPAKVVHGYARRETETWQDVLRGGPNHAWNEVFVGGRWLTMDVTWDAGFIEGDRFVPFFSRKYFDPDPEAFARTHRKTGDKY